jgi:hypothetical protein
MFGLAGIAPARALAGLQKAHGIRQAQGPTNRLASRCGLVVGRAEHPTVGVAFGLFPAGFQQGFKASNFLVFVLGKFDDCKIRTKKTARRRLEALALFRRYNPKAFVLEIM